MVTEGYKTPRLRFPALKNNALSKTEKGSQSILTAFCFAEIKQQLA
ncbi:hypothetical protein GCHA_2306 [Paraglaciecola chathamensis S18K6]|uniref:Uncharacterized protein n=1 Tax=Paraglaciecola chathamensis S18K6 TaxID=1127672 RepID=A0AAV3UZG7_9ALTE|nr:hypothetical protein GCHA_2306 [Paraglaciecola chathamensis S18K6]